MMGVKAKYDICHVLLSRRLNGFAREFVRLFEIIW